MTRSRSKALYWAGVGATLGFLVGLYEYGSKSILGAVDYTDTRRRNSRSPS